MISTLVWLAALTLGARAHTHLDEARLDLPGPFSALNAPGLIRHDVSGRTLDLTGFANRTRSLCDLLLTTRHARFEDPGVVARGPVEARASRQPRAYATVTVRVGPDLVQTRATLYRPDQLFSTLSPTGARPANGIPVVGRISALTSIIARTAARLEGRPFAGDRAVTGFGKLTDDGDFDLESLSVPLARVFSAPHFLTVLHGQILPTERGWVMVTPSGRRRRLVRVPAPNGSEELRLVHDIHETTDAVVAGLELEDEVKVFTLR